MLPCSKIIDATLDKLFISLPVKLFKKSVMTNVLNSHGKRKKALLYFKTDTFCSKRVRNSFTHTNNFEIYEMAKILDRLGFSVDVIDRNASWEEISEIKHNPYDLYLGNAAGNSAKYHIDILKNFHLKKKIVFAAGPEPEINNELTLIQHLDFNKRNNKNCTVRRLVKGSSFQERFNGIDAIFYVGNNFSKKTYQKFNVPLFPIHPSSNPVLKMVPEEVENKSAKHFIYLGGTGLICKGLDLVLEAFDGLSDLNLDVCGPSDEEDFWMFYKPLLKRNPQIRFHGFVDIGGSLFNKISTHAAFYLFPSSSEGCATSVTSCMRRGIIPIINVEAGVDIADFGIAIQDKSVTHLRKIVLKASKMPRMELNKRISLTYENSKKYTAEGFRESFELAMKGLLETGSF